MNEMLKLENIFYTKLKFRCTQKKRLADEMTLR